MISSAQHDVVQQLTLHRSSHQQLVLHMQVQPEQQKTVQTVRSPLSSLTNHTTRSPATRSLQPWATGFQTPERLLADEVKSSPQQLCLPLYSLPSTQLAAPVTQLFAACRPSSRMLKLPAQCMLHSYSIVHNQTAPVSVI